ncbi:MAG: ATPase, T2SS/T4P/T4SS family [Candidatus Sungiibacteriota bacterium]
MSDFPDDKVRRRIDQLRHKEAENAAKRAAEHSQIPYIDLLVLPIEIDALKIIPEKDARDGELAVFQAAGMHLKIALRNPEKPEALALLNTLLQRRYTYERFLASIYALERAWDFYKRIPEHHGASAGAIELSLEKITAIQQQIATLPEIRAAIEKTFFGRTGEALEVMLAGALALDASDIHIEPQKQSVRLRMRLDGTLHDIADLPIKLSALLLSRVKLISELKLNIHDRSQDGRFTISMQETAVEIRTSILPGPDGENVVMRVLNPKSIMLSFRDLGLQPWVADIIEKELRKPNGLILTTGPTGSGKTTTLYTFLRAVHSPEIKIITIEDPIEYHLAGIEQTQVDQEKGYDFANGLRAIVRQDPDVILVGEIRDLETAETAMHASLTGHLVFSTLHTNDAAGTIPRLIDLGVRPAIIAPAINVAMAQRLVRKLCTACRVPIEKSDPIIGGIAKELTLLPTSIAMPDTAQWTIFSAKKNGCPACGGIGYKGRIGVYEIILINDALEQLILQSAPELDIKKEAVAQGQITMHQDGLLKIAAGITDIEELTRVVG